MPRRCVFTTSSFSVGGASFWASGRCFAGSEHSFLRRRHRALCSCSSHSGRLQLPIQIHRAVGELVEGPPLRRSASSPPLLPSCWFFRKDHPLLKAFIKCQSLTCVCWERVCVCVKEKVHHLCPILKCICDSKEVNLLRLDVLPSVTLCGHCERQRAELRPGVGQGQVLSGVEATD